MSLVADRGCEYLSEELKSILKNCGIHSESTVQVFGCAVYACNPEGECRKLNKKAQKSLFIGYRGTAGNYKVWDEKKQKSYNCHKVVLTVIAPKLEPKPSHWGSPQSLAAIEKTRRGGMPKSTMKQIDWCLGVWTNWLSYHSQKLVEESDKQFERVKSCWSLFITGFQSL